MRCSICDFCPDAPSAYYLGVFHDRIANKQLKLDRRTGDFICSVCYDEVGDNLRETEPEDVDFNAPALSVW